MFSCTKNSNCEFMFHINSLHKHEFCHKTIPIKKILNKDVKQLYIHAHDYVPPSQDNFLAIHQNVRSIEKNHNHLQLFIESLRQKGSNLPKIIAVTETWLPYDHLLSLPKYSIPKYQVEHDARKSGNRGGAGLYTHDSVEYSRRNDFQLNCAESVWLEIKQRKNEKALIIGVIYSSPCERDDNLFCENLNTVMEKISVEGKNCVILGDMNFDLFKMKSTHRYCQTLLSNGFKNLFGLPTRSTSSSATLIDHIISNYNMLLNDITAGVISNDISDHDMTFVSLSTFEVKKPTKPITTFSFKNYQAENVVNDLKVINWNSVLCEANTVDSYNNFIDIIRPLHDKHIPRIKILPKNIYIQPWMTQGIRLAQKKRSKLHKKYKMNPTLQNRQRFITYRNRLCSITRKAEKDYYKKLIDDANGDKQKTWHAIHNIIGNQKRHNGIPSSIISENGTEITDPVNICEEMNNFFVGVGSKLAGKIADVGIDPVSYISPPATANTFFMDPVSPFEVFQKLKSIDPSKSHGPDTIHPRFLRDGADYLALPLQHLINLSLSEGSVPDQLKIARIIPIHKAGNKKLSTNYRPISILSILSKIIEGFVYDRLYKYVTQKGILNDSQFGFQKGKNTLTALLKLINGIQDNLDKQNHTLGIFIDLKKAFDTVQHSILLKKTRKVQYTWHCPKMVSKLLV